MKTKVKRLSKRSLAVLLGVLMLVTSIGLGSMITASADTYYMLCGYNQQNPSNWSTYATSTSLTSFSLTPSNFGKSSWETGVNYYIGVSSSTSASNMYCQSGTATVTKSGSISSAYSQSYGNYRFALFSVSSTSISSVNVSVTVSGSNITYALSTTTGSSGCSSDKTYIVTGDSAITGTNGWNNTSTANQLTYDSTLKLYKKTYTVSYTSAFNWRIVESGSWATTWGYNRSNELDSNNICTYAAQGSDNNIQMTLSRKAYVEIRFDDSKTDTSAITVIVTPYASTVTAAVSPASSGTATVNSGSSATVDFGASVNLAAVPAANYHFGSWTTANGNLSIASTSSSSTTATVSGTDTVTANFVKDSFSVTRGTGTGFTITTPSTNTSKQWGTSVSVTATAASGYFIDSLYYLVNNAGSPQSITISSYEGTSTSARTSATGSFTMPTNNVTLYATVHEQSSSTITYGVCTGQSSYGYVSVGEYYNSATTMKHTIDSGTKVLEGTKVNFGARPALHYKFVGWYDNAAGTGTALSTNQNYTVTSPSGNYYAKFEAETPASTDPRDPESGYVKLFLNKSMVDGAPYNYAWTWNKGSGNDDSWMSIDKTKTYTMNSNTCYMIKIPATSSSTNVSARLVQNNNWDNLGYAANESYNLTTMSPGNCYYAYPENGNNWATRWNAASYTSTTTEADGATTAYFPVKYYVTNPDKGASTVRSYMFAQAGGSITFYHSPSDTTNWKTNRTTTSFSSNLTNSKTTSTYTSRTMPSTYSSTPVFTATFVEKEYYKVTFSAGAGGTVTATAGGTAITSGTMVQEGKSVTIKATPSSGYSLKGWTASGSITGTSTSTSRTFTIGADTTARAYFTRSIGTSNTATYFGWARATTSNSDTNVYPGDWTNFTSTYKRDGHIYAYIDSVSENYYYYISAYDDAVTSSSSDQDQCQKQYFRTAAGTEGSVWCNTNFSSYITNCGRSSWGTNDNPCWEGRCNYAHFKVGSGVKALIIDLGPDDGNGVAQTHVADRNHNFAENNYRIIPVFNTDVNKVSVYAKDASYRGNSNYDYLTGIANTVITTSSYVTGRVQHDEFETAVATKGQSITVTTTIDSNHRSNFYVRGFSFNGTTPALLSANTSGGTYSQTYTIPADFDYDYLEITPIYYSVHGENDSSFVQFYIENYDKALEAKGWGNTLSVYPYYQNASGSYAATKHNAFGGYPGQPVIYYGGRRFIEIPTHYTTLTVDGNDTEECFIKGVTLSNDYFDIVHRDYCREVDDHLQTYDYDDFYKIYKETSDGLEVNHSGSDGRDEVADQITFAFKYRETTNNFSDSSNTTSYSNTGKTVKAPYSSFTVAEKTSKFGNGWEALLDYHDRPIDLFGKQLTTAQQSEEPILVVSDDYAINYVGRYATTWTVYAKNAAGTSYTKIAEIAPSALIVTSASRLADGSPYPAVADESGKPSQPKLSSFTTAYNALKAYAGKPVEITYESAIRNDSSYAKYWSMTNGSSEVATRNDGRWYYSYAGEQINANLRIDYSDDGGEHYSVDSFKSGTNKGSVTGASVQFTNTSSDSEGPYELAGLHDTADYEDDEHPIVTNNNHYFKFAASGGSGYIFAGWWFEKDGIATNVNEDLTQLNGKSQMTSNATFVARYIKNPSGSLTINHTVADGSTGDADTYVGVKAIKGNSETWLTGENGNEGYVADGFEISDATYTSYKSGYTFRIYLKTVPNDFTDFSRFSSAEDGHSENYFSTANQSTSSGATITYFDVEADDLFELDANSFPVQQFDTLTYYSHLTQKTLNYNFNYTYPAYLSKYGTQGYRVTGTFNYDDLNKYMTMSGSTLQFKDTASKTTVLEKLAPYEDNFMEEISWNTTAASTSFSGNTISATIASNTASAKKLDLTFEFNYATDANLQPITAATYNDEEISIPITGNDRPDHMTLFKKNGEFVKAPQTLMDGETEMIFRYWSVTNVPDSKHSAEEYTRCYDDEFNLALFQNSIVKSVYTPKDTENRDGYDPDTQEAADTTNGIKISFIENSRNQYNDNQSGTGMTSTRSAMGDRMYTDFLLNFNNIAGNKILKDEYATSKKAGLLIEVVGDVDYEDGKYVTKTEAEYREQYGATIAEIGTKLSGKDVTVNQTERLTDFILNGSSNTSGFSGVKSEFLAKELDNKNRIQYAYSLANRSHTDLSVLNNRYKVYRAYAYIADVNGNSLENIEISNKPTYFTIYDMASIQN